MSSATVTSKGQITIPIDVRTRLKVRAGDRVEFVETSPGRFEIVATTRSVSALKGLFRSPGKTVSIEKMNETIVRRGAARR